MQAKCNGTREIFHRFSGFLNFQSFSEGFLVAHRLERIGKRIENSKRRQTSNNHENIPFVKLGVSQLISDASISFVQLELV